MALRETGFQYAVSGPGASTENKGFFAAISVIFVTFGEGPAGSRRKPGQPKRARAVERSTSGAAE